VRKRKNNPFALISLSFNPFTVLLLPLVVVVVMVTPQNTR